MIKALIGKERSRLKNDGIKEVGAIFTMVKVIRQL